MFAFFAAGIFSAKAAECTSYSTEGFALLTLNRFVLAPRIQCQFLWSQTVISHGEPGGNVPCDLHLENIRHGCINAIGALGSKISDEARLRSVLCRQV